uniref:Uncharacterized protein n=1 Tax=Glossina palpalis gambiensis TaxID=67801 RepID=A0A1B0B978_9MUSC
MYISTTMLSSMVLFCFHFGAAIALGDCWRQSSQLNTIIGFFWMASNKLQFMPVSLEVITFLHLLQFSAILKRFEEGPLVGFTVTVAVPVAVAVAVAVAVVGVGVGVGFGAPPPEHGVVAVADGDGGVVGVVTGTSSSVTDSVLIGVSALGVSTFTDLLQLAKEFSQKIC